jgi:small subunit ribosomal protein S17
MPKRIAVGVVKTDKMNKSRRVEIPRLVQHAKYGKILHRKTVCHIHDENNESHVGDTVEIVECPPMSKLKRWKLVRILKKSTAVDLVAMRAAEKALEQQTSETPAG